MENTNSRNWRTEFDSRHKIVEEIIEDYYSNLRNVLQFEEQIYNTAITKSDYLEKVSSQIMLPVRSIGGYNQNPVSNSTSWQRHAVTQETSKSRNEYGSTGPITEEEIIGFLKQNSPKTTVDLVTNFKSRLKSPKDKKAFAVILKKISKIRKSDGSGFVVLKENYSK
ncbi:hypothetical protein ACHQM5_018649 [Ranunculus cassubicifolius]